MRDNFRWSALEDDFATIIPNDTIPKLLEKLNNLYLDVKDSKK